ncbi:hypothetical protein F8M41_020076 [Gigaspora margarita]|uniref:Jacalin-type lectin domain-containing protein n=1 Tax=Gigaspora margarita TaxID=4874 RepID=A0A8H4EU49_GIGMA|nr:hypothetical protein F8M41_020076 [Gigaspora margarita]
MTITVKTISNTYGGGGGFNANDFEIIIYQIVDGESIKNINVKRIKVQTDSANGYLNSLQFIYNVETNNGERLVTGAQRVGTKSYGKNDTTDTLFTLPAGILFGNNAGLIDSLGTYVVVEVPTNSSSTTSNPLSTTSNSSSDITSTSFIILSCFTSILGFIVLVIVIIFLWRKFHRGYIPTL